MQMPLEANPDDHALMAAAGRGDEKAFALLVERHHTLVIHTIAKMLGDEHEAHDLAQQVFLRVWRSAPRFRPQAKFTTWLMTIVRNLVFNESRRRYRSQLVSIEQKREEHPARELPDPHSQSADHLASQHELTAAIDAAIAALPEQQRLALILRRYHDQSYEAIAEVLGTSVPSVKSLLFRARGTLKDQLNHWRIQR